MQLSDPLRSSGTIIYRLVTSRISPSFLNQNRSQSERHVAVVCLYTGIHGFGAPVKVL